MGMGVAHGLFWLWVWQSVLCCTEEKKNFPNIESETMDNYEKCELMCSEPT